MTDLLDEMRTFIFLLPFVSSLMAWPCAFAQDRAAWLAATSINSIGCEDFTGPLYRGSRGGYFPLSRIVRNMLGDLTAEHPSWRLTALSEQVPGPLTEAQWRDLKEKAGEEIKAVSGCQLSNEAMAFTVLNLPISTKKASKAIPVSSDFDFSLQYSRAESFQGEPRGKEGGSVIRIDEHIPRGARAIQGEYYIPVVIPAEDISQGWANGLRLIKEVGLDGQLKQISIYKEAGPKSTPPTSSIIAKIVCCRKEYSECKLDSLHEKIQALTETTEILSSQKFQDRKCAVVNPDFNSPLEGNAVSDVHSKLSIDGNTNFPAAVTSPPHSDQSGSANSP